MSAGWTDLRCHLTDPGHEQKDTIDTLLDTAAAALGLDHSVGEAASRPVLTFPFCPRCCPSLLGILSAV